MPRERVLITVKTYPTLSKKYGETVCTAGVRADGFWVRIYPVPFRRLGEEGQYRKFDWIELDLMKARSDPRPESRRPVDPKAISVVGHMGTDDGWSERRRLLLKTAKVYDRLQPLLNGAKENTISLAVFKPARILDFVWEECERDWDAAKVAAMRNNAAQGELFAEDAWRQTFAVMPKLPYNVSYRFLDADGRKSELQVLDWEAGQLFWNCMKATKNNEAAALEKVRQKYLDEFAKKDLHFFLGTMQQFHGFAPNPWVIIGVFPIPNERQMDLL
ncbi:MAG: hypothetical protein HY343_07950 [Lentisphaerae bacterium]|nr:hypothetical protein [Lentisphaerota bacterium]